MDGTHRAQGTHRPHADDYDTLVACTLQKAGTGQCPHCGHEAIPPLIEAIARAAAGDFTQKPDLPQDDHPVSLLATGIRFLMEDLEDATTNTGHERLGRQIVHTAAEALTAPLTPMLLQLHVLRRHLLAAPPDPVVDRSLTILARNLVRMERQVRTCIDLARAERPLPPEAFRTVALDAVVQAVVTDLQERAAGRRVTLRHQTDGPCRMRGEPRYLEQAVWHLVANAIDASPADAHVTIHLHEGEAATLLTVQDHGDGLPTGAEDQAFEPFVRLHPTRAGGLGLGLTLAYRTAALHGGRLWAESQGPGRGTRFSLMLPRHA